MLKNVKRFAVAGDWHGNSNYAVKAIRYAVKNGAETIVHVGDFGAWPDEETWLDPSSYLEMVEREADRNNIVVMFADGNHEHHDWLKTFAVGEDGVRRISEHVWHLPRGTRWVWDDLRFMALGGAYSVDRAWRVKGVSFFKDEVLSAGEAFTAVQGGDVDVMFTHDCPDNVEIPMDHHMNLPEGVLREAEHHRALLGGVVDAVKPSHLYHGHYHVKYDGVRKDSTQIHGLNCDGSPSLAHNVTVVDTAQLK